MRVSMVLVGPGGGVGVVVRGTLRVADGIVIWSGLARVVLIVGIGVGGVGL